MALDDTRAAEGLDHATLRRMVDVAAEMTETARQHAEQCRDYYDGNQLTSEELAVLRKRKQPALVINRIKRKVDAIVGIEQKGRVDPRALPRNPQDEDGADVATKALVFVDDVERLDVKRSAFCYNLAVEGTGGVEVKVKKNRDGTFDPQIVRLRWEEIFHDPYSRELDFSDAGYTGVQKWMSFEAAVEFAKGFGTEKTDEELRAMLEVSYNPGSGDTYEDRPREGAGTHWGDRKTRRVRIAYMYYRRGNAWRLALICGGGLIHDQESPYYDEEGDACNAMILQSCYIDRENRRYGMVSDWLPMQDEINKRRSKALHMLNSRQTMGQKGAVADVAKMKRELALPDGHAEYDQDPATTVPSLQIVPNNDQLAGQFELLQESKSEIDMLGPNAALLGQMEGEQSGRAIIAQQQSGMAEIAPFYDSLRDWTIRVYRAIWNRIRQFWTEPRWIRVTDEQEKLQFIGLNGAMNADGTPGMSVGELDVDIIVDMTPEYASLQMEQFQQIVELVKNGLVQLPPDVIIQASQLRDKSKLMEMLNNPQAQQQAQMQQQIAMEGAMAEVEDKKASAMLKQAQAQKAMAEAQAPAPGQPGPLPVEAEKIAAEAENKRADTAKKLAEVEKIRTETALKPAEFEEERRQARMGEMREASRDAESAMQARSADARENARFHEEARSGRVSEAREGARMSEEFRSGRASEELQRTQADRDYEIARKQASKPRAKG